MEKTTQDQQRRNKSEKDPRAEKNNDGSQIKNSSKSPSERKSKESLDKIDQASWESFPASDSPGWGP